MKKKFTHLETLITEGFKKVNERFDKLESADKFLLERQFELEKKMDNNFDKLDSKMDKMLSHMDWMVKKYRRYQTGSNCRNP